MIVINADNPTINLIATLTEKVTISDPNYLFVFTHVETRATVSFVFNYTDDISLYRDRYNEFVMETGIFTKDGHYIYEVYEQESFVNTDITGLTLIEEGQARVILTRPTVYTSYSTPTTYSAYNG